MRVLVSVDTMGRRFYKPNRGIAAFAETYEGSEAMDHATLGIASGGRADIMDWARAAVLV